VHSASSATEMGLGAQSRPICTTEKSTLGRRGVMQIWEFCLVSRPS
jgi:hypothetical protein